jgi:hypothetical protein
VIVTIIPLVVHLKMKLSTSSARATTQLLSPGATEGRRIR